MYLPNDRTVHQSPLPDVGGLAMYVGFLAAMLTAWLVDAFDLLFTSSQSTVTNGRHSAASRIGPSKNGSRKAYITTPNCTSASPARTVPATFAGGDRPRTSSMNPTA